MNSNNAAGYQLASGDPVMAIGGFNGTDPSPTLAQFEKYVSEGKIHYYIAGLAPAVVADSVEVAAQAAAAMTLRLSPRGWSHTSRPRRSAA